MNDRQLTIANGFLKVLEKHGGTQNIDIVTNELEVVGIDIEENPLDFEVVERYLIRNKIIESVPPDNYFYNALENLNEVLNKGVIEFVKQREEAKRQPQIIGRNIVMNNGDNSQGSIYDSSSSQNTTTTKIAAQTEKNKLGSIILKIFVGVVIAVIAWWITTGGNS